jgi:branched-chain amino acid transport system permease protein
MQFFETLISGILLGSLYALAASGLSLGFGIMGIINLAHAELIMLGAYVTFWLWSFAGVNPLLTIFGSMIALFAFSLILYRVSIRKIIGEEQLVSLILTYGISIVLWNFAQVAFTSTFRSVDFSAGTITVSGSHFPVNKILSFVIVTLAVIGLHLFLKYAGVGKSIRAVSQNATIAAISGINVERTRMIGFGIAGLLAGVAGSLIAIQWAIYPLMGEDLILKCFAIVAIGGIGSLPGSLAGGIILGLAESIGTGYWDSTMANIFAPLLLIFTFLFRPQGLFGVAERVD